MPSIDEQEWLEADGLGGFASGTASGVRTRRYHALLLAATTPPTGRMVLVNGMDVWVTTPGGRFGLSTQRYPSDVLHPDGYRHLVGFTNEPWPAWEFETPDGVRVVQEIVVAYGGGGTVVTWRVTRADGPVTLEVRPFFSGRDYHSTHHENSAFAFDPEAKGDTLTWRVYNGLPPIRVQSNGTYAPAREWYRNFLYTAERERGLDDREDLASPGVFTWPLESAGTEAVLVLTAVVRGAAIRNYSALQQARAIRGSERQRRAAFPTPLDRAADAFLVRRGSGRSIVAGYPWFTDWGRDTFIAIRGLCIATGRLADARDILLEWGATVSEGMLPNRFADSGEIPEFNAVDASLWFVIAVHALLDRVGSDGSVVCGADRARLHHAVQQIVRGYSDGTRYRIHADVDGLLAAGQPGVQLTWMDARVDGREVTPRIGKPVEIQALWLNALWIAAQWDSKWASQYDAGRRSFDQRFWNDERSCLYDVIDENHVAGRNDGTLRPNQVLAVGGLPVALVEGARARAVVDLVERELLTPFGLRSLGPGERGYGSRYDGGPSARDGIYHQGIVWPWLMGPFVDAWVRVRGGTPAARHEAHAKFVAPLLAHVQRKGFGHLWEITDAEAPFQGRGCPFQAWSLGELIRVDRELSAS